MSLAYVKQADDALALKGEVEQSPKLLSANCKIPSSFDPGHSLLVAVVCTIGRARRRESEGSKGNEEVHHERV
jgi:hypothetical protein